MKQYTIIVPALDRTGPVNVAFDLGRAARLRGWLVRVLYLSECEARTDIEFASEVRRFRLSDIWRISGIVHTHCLRPDLLGWILSWNQDVELITTVHNFFLLDVGFDYSAIYVYIAWKLWRQALRRYDHVVCISGAMQRYYRRLIPWLPTDLVHNFRRAPEASTDEFTEIKEWVQHQRAEQRRILVYVGGLTPRKNILPLLVALPAHPSIALIVCGRGPLADQLGELARTKGLKGRIHFAGQVSKPTIILERADALVLPSRAEGFPLVVLEAASVGVPSLLSNIAVHRELAKIGFGSTFNHRRFTDLTDVLESLCTGSKTLSDDLRTLWSSRYTPESGFLNYERLFLQNS